MTRNEKAIALVKGGLSYADAGKRLGVSRNVVAGICRDAGLKVGFGPDRREAFRRKVAISTQKAWNRLSPEERRRRWMPAVVAMLAARGLKLRDAR